MERWNLHLNRLRLEAFKFAGFSGSSREMLGKQQGEPLSSKISQMKDFSGSSHTCCIMSCSKRAWMMMEGRSVRKRVYSSVR